MGDNLKKYVDEHRQDFDNKEPGGDLWGEIDARMEAKQSSRISSKWLKRFIYLAFSASAIVIAVYLVSKNQVQNPGAGAVLADQGQAIVGQESGSATDQLNLNTGQADRSAEDHSKRETAPAKENELERKKQTDKRGQELLVDAKGDSVSPGQNQEKDLFQQNNPELTEVKTESEAEKNKSNAAVEKKENNSGRKKKKEAIRVPEEPVRLNTYTGTLYDKNSICDVLRVFKFPGLVDVYADGGIRRNAEGYKVLIRTKSCSLLEKMEEMKAVWVKGRTDKQLKVSVKKKFRNIYLVKSDGRKINPEAISHYYPGLGVISEYRGQYFNMVFLDQVEMILFFKEAEEGDKVIVDGSIEAIIKKQP